MTRKRLVSDQHRRSIEENSENSRFDAIETPTAKTLWRPFLCIQHKYTPESRPEEYLRTIFISPDFMAVKAPSWQSVLHHGSPISIMNDKCRVLQNSWWDTESEWTPSAGDPTRVISTIKKSSYWIKVPHRPINRALLCRVFQIAAWQQLQTRSFLDISPKATLSIFGAKVSRQTCPWPLPSVGSAKMDHSTKMPITQLIVSQSKFWIARNVRLCKARLSTTSDLEMQTCRASWTNIASSVEK